MSESDELYTLRQQFFTGELEEVSQISLEDYNDETQDLAIEYKLRSLILLGKFKEVQSLAKGIDNAVLAKTVSLYADFVQGQDVSSKFDALISEEKRESIVQNLGSFYLVKQGRTDEAITLLQHHENSLEAVLLLVQLYLSQGKLELAEKEVSVASSYAQDSIIFNLAEAYVNSAKNGESLRGSLYFFEELSHSHPTVKTLVGDLVLNFQLRQFPEADEVLRKIAETNGASAELLANEYAYAQIKGDSTEASDKLSQLSKLDPNFPTVLDIDEKNKLFDSIVEKYNSQIVN